MTLMRYLQSHALKSEMFFNSLQKFKAKTKTKTKTNIIFFFFEWIIKIQTHTHFYRSGGSNPHPLGV